MGPLIVHISSVLNNKTARQSMILYASQLLVVGLSVAINVINTRFLGPSEYGILSFCLTLLGFSVLFFEFGIFTAGSRILALCRDIREEREYIGTLLVAAVIIGIMFGAFIFLSSFFVDNIFTTNINIILLGIAALSIIFPFQFFIQQICQGTNSIIRLSLHKVIWYLLYLFLLVFVATFFKLTAFISLIISLSGLLIASLAILYSLKPRFNSMLGRFAVLLKETRDYGFKVYLGRVMGMSTYNLNRLFISYFVNTTSVGFYFLAETMTYPITMLSGSIATSLYKNLVHNKRIPYAVNKYNFLWLSLSCLGLIVFGGYLLEFLFSNRYSPAVPLILPLTLAAFFNGLIQPYNNFLMAKGKGNYLQTTAAIMTVCNITGSLLLIPHYGVLGAGYASLFSMISYYLACTYYYNKTIT
jgi:O-antigen/teichoic acid export membrane protein